MYPDKPSSSSSTAPGMGKFVPKSRLRRSAKPVKTKTESAGDDADEEVDAKALRRLLNERMGKRRPKIESKSSVDVAFAHGAASSNLTRMNGELREGNDDKSNGFNLRDSIASSPSTGRIDGGSGSSVNTVVASSKKTKKEYREPWDYKHTYYPTTLPLRQPYSGDPEQLDELEFGEAASSLEYDENATNSALELGLLEKNEEVQMLFLQLPPNLPLDKQVARAYREKGKEKVGSSILSRETSVPASAKGKEIVGSASSSQRGNGSQKGCSLEELPKGYMGKMLVYKSGAIKLKLGEHIYDVSPGTGSIFAQDVAAINTVNKNCCVLGELRKRAVVTPDIDSILDNAMDLG